MKRNILIIIAIALFCNSYSQTLEPIYIKNNKFYEGCNEFYPKALVYNFDIIEHYGENTLWVGTRRFYWDPTCIGGENCINCLNTSNCYPYGYESGLKYIRQHFQAIKSLGFNVVKLSGFHVYNKNDTLVGLYGRKIFGLFNGEPYYKEHFRLISQVLDVAREEGLRVMMALGGSNCDRINAKYTEFLELISEYFKDNPTLISYDIASEAVYSITNQYDKPAIRDMSLAWYNAIKSHCSQLVSIGTWGYRETVQWDIKLLACDFMNYHYYTVGDIPDPEFMQIRRELQWLGQQNLTLPWITGETGYWTNTPADDPAQVEYVKSTMKWTAGCGGIGYTYFNFHDSNEKYGIFRHNPDVDTTGGIVHDTLAKQITNEFKNFNPAGSYSCAAVPDTFYYNPYAYTYTHEEIYGYVYDNNNNPIKDAVIRGRKSYIDTLGKTHHILYYTISDATGYFKLHTNYSYVINQLYVSAAGMSLSTKDSIQGIKGNQTIILSPITPPVLNTINSGDSVTWANKVYPMGNVTVNGTLTIKSQVGMSSNRKITVEEGGKLIIDGGKISNFCNTGASFNAIVAKPGSTVEIKNGATIENAKTAISANSATLTISNCTFNYNDSALSIKNDTKFSIQNCTFFNNETSIEINNNNLTSHITDCNFNIDDQIIYDHPNSNAINISNSDYVIIKGSHFKNSQTDIGYGSDFRGKAINIYHSGLVLTGCENLTCSTENRNTFDGFTEAIYVDNGSDLKKLIIRKNDFINNMHAINLFACNNPIILQNNISIGEPAGYYQDLSNITDINFNQYFFAYGINLNNCTSYKIEENNFTTTSSNIAVIGIVLTSENTTNQIYRNTFTGLPFATIFQSFTELQYRTQVFPPLVGLQVRCNTFTSNKYDIATTTDNILNHQQGYGDIPTGNLFYPDASNITNIYAYPNTFFSYYYNTLYTNELPVKISSGVSIHPTYLTPNWDEYCPSHLSISKPPVEEVLQTYDELTYHSMQVSDSITTLVDAGNTDWYLKKISQNHNPKNMKKKLLDASPWLSDTVMVSLIGKDNYFEAQNLTEVLVSNPQSATSKAVQTSLDNMTNPLPNTLRMQINSNDTVLSPMSAMEAQLSTINNDKEYYANEIINYYLNDTLPSSKDALIAFLASQNTLKYDYKLFSYYYTIGQTTDARNLLSQVQTKYTLTTDQLSYYNKFSQLYDVLISLKEDSLTIKDLDATQIQSIRSVAQDTVSLPGSIANRIISKIDSIPFKEWVRLPIIPDSLNLHGKLISSCNNINIANQKIYFVKQDSVITAASSPTTTDANGNFSISYFDMLMIGDSLPVGFATTGNIPVENFELKTIPQWMQTANLTIKASKPQLVISVSDTTPCFGDTVLLSAIVTGGIPPYTYNWSTGDTTSVINLPSSGGSSSLSLGEGWGEVSDSTFCTDTSNYNLTFPEPLTSSITYNPVMCYGDSIQLFLQVNGGTPPYSYNWSTSDTTSTELASSTKLSLKLQTSNLFPVPYTLYLSVTDNNNCTSTSIDTIFIPSALQAVIIGTDLSCDGETNGSADLTITGGTHPYNIIWSNGETIEDLSNILAGTYTATATDANGCFISKTIDISNPVTSCSPNSFVQVGEGFGNLVSDLYEWNGKLISNGDFVNSGSISLNGIAQYDDANNEWIPMGTGFNYFSSSNPKRVYAITEYNNELYAAGYFTADGTGNTPYDHIAKWDDTNKTWNKLSNEDITGNSSFVLSLAVYKNELYAGGYFKNVGGTPIEHIAKWNGSAWSGLDIGITGSTNPRIMALTVFNDELYVGGLFVNAGDKTCWYIAKWDGTNWYSLNYGTNGAVRTICVYNNELYIGGVFTTAGGRASNYIAKWNNLTSRWEPLVDYNTNVKGTNGYVNTMYVFNNELYVGGDFTEAGGIASEKIAKWNGTSWSSICTGIDNTIWSITSHDNYLYIGGDFNTASGNSAQKIVKWYPPQADAGSDLTICTGQSTNLTASGGISYIWNTGETSKTITVSPLIPTTYTVTVYSAYGCPSTTSVTVDTIGCESKSTLITSQSATSMIGNEEVTTSFSNINLANHKEIAPENNKTENAENIMKIDVFPNPAADIINLNFLGFDLQNSKTITITTQDVHGREIYLKENIPFEKSISIDTSNLQNGVYFTCIKIADNEFYRWIVIYK